MSKVSPEEAERLLAAVQAATDARDAARDLQVEAIRAAVDAGVPVSHIAKSAGISREQVYRLTRP